MTQRTILCGPVRFAQRPSRHRGALYLNLWGSQANITLKIEDMLRGMLGDVPELFRDLVDIAAYVYAADQALVRGRDDYGGSDGWRRDLAFYIAVRRPDFWNRPDNRLRLIETLAFLTEDVFAFEFEPYPDAPSVQQYFDFSTDLATVPVEEVMLFSGGLDSLGGGVREVLVDKRHVLLVHHRSSTKRVPLYHTLLESLRGAAGRYVPWHLPIRLDKDRQLNREFTQRSRSFLFAALAATLAVMVGRNRIRFYENGVTGINLPLSAEVLGSRASRTTHPRFLRLMSLLLGELAGSPFPVENPFGWMTRTEVVRSLVTANHADWIGLTNSCSHTWQSTKQHPHCGICSQCIDRRFAVLATKQEDNDPAEKYGVDLVTGGRKAGPIRTLLAIYVETANWISRMGMGEFFSRYGEATRVLRQQADLPDQTAFQLFQMYRRHAQQITEVVDAAVAAQPAQVRLRNLAEGSLIHLVASQGGAAAGKAKPGSEADLPDNVFRRHGKVWQVRYAGGKAFMLLPHRGVAYLHLLLSRPNAWMTAAELYCAVTGQRQAYLLGNEGKGADESALTAYRVRIHEMQEKMEEFREEGDEAQIRELERQRELLLHELQVRSRKRSRKRSGGSDRDRVRNAVGIAITRALKEIEEEDEQLVEHLKSPQLARGFDLSYRPSVMIVWET